MSPPIASTQAPVIPSIKALDAVKGVLIVCVVFGHNLLLARHAPLARQAIYNFHVAGFLLLPFIIPSKRLSWTFARDRATRYFVPYVVSCGFAACMYLVIFRPEPATWLGKVLMALPVGSARALDDACGFQLYWFLPSLFTLVLVRALHHSTTTPGRLGLLAISLAFAGIVGGLSEPLKYWLPLGLPIALMLLPSGLIVERVTRATDLRRWRLLLPIPWLACLVIGVHFAIGINVGKLKLYTISDPALWAFQQVNWLAAFLVLIAWSEQLAKVPGLASFGKHSLVIYLSHSLIYQFLLRIIGAQQGRASLPVALATFSLTLVCSLALSFGLTKWTFFRERVLPRNYAQWTHAWRATFRALAAR